MVPLLQAKRHEVESAILDAMYRARGSATYWAESMNEGGAPYLVDHDHLDAQLGQVRRDADVRDERLALLGARGVPSRRSYQSRMDINLKRAIMR